MKKYLVIGNPIEHSLSPKLHNRWIKENNIDAVYDKKQLNESEIKEIVGEVKKEKINGINVTVPFKKSVIPFLDQLTPLADETQSVNTIFRKDITDFLNGTVTFIPFILSLLTCSIIPGISFSLSSSLS